MNKIYIISLTLIFSFKLFSTQQMPREVSIAFDQFKIIMQTNLSLYPKPDNNNCLIKNNISITNKKFSMTKLKSDTFWVWNQSNSKTMKEYQNYQVVIKKYSPRKKNSDIKNRLPEYKLWKYELFQNYQLINTIFWTEKGKEIIEAQIITNEQEPIKIVIVNLIDLRFLEEFMEPLDALDIFY